MQRAEAGRAEANVRRRGMAAPSGGGSSDGFASRGLPRATAYSPSFTRSLNTLRTLATFGAATAVQ